MEKPFPVPLSYYDYLHRRCSRLFPYVEKDLVHVQEEGLNGPFMNMDEYAAYAKDYLKEETQALVDYTVGALYEQYPESRAREIAEEFVKSDGLNRAVYSFETNYTTALNFELFGKKTFYVTPNLYEHLAETSIDTDCQLARLPFPNCLFVYDSPLAKDLLYRTNNHTVRTYEGAVSVFASEITEEGERKLVLFVFHADNTQVHYGIKRQLLLREGWTLEQALRTDWLKLNPDSVEDNSFAISDETFYTSGLNFFRSVVNTILYLGSNDPDLVQQLSPYRQMEERLFLAKSRDKRKEIKGELKRTPRLDYVVVGRNVPRLMPDAMAGGSAREMHVWFIVRGHWRNQPYGAGNSLRRPLWVKPYYKGPEIAELINNRPYVVS